MFTTLYRSWCHNAVSLFSLCLLAQAYEHASNMLYILCVLLPSLRPHPTQRTPSADLDITVQMLVQIDKLVQLIESPVFTCTLFAPPNPILCTVAQFSDRYPTPTPRTREIPLSLQMPLWHPNAPPSKFRLPLTP